MAEGDTLSPLPEDFKEIRQRCIKILREAGCDDEIIKHCEAVAELSMEIASLHENRGVDKALIYAGALLHDIGRSRTHGVDHAFIGGRIAADFGLDEKLIRIIERHIGGGISRDEAKKLGLPDRDFIPETMEEKIVAHADNLVDGTRRRSIDEEIEEQKRRLGEDHPSIRRMLRLHEEVMGRDEILARKRHHS